MTRATLTVDTNEDAEVTVLDAALNRVARAVGYFSEPLDVGLYKIKVNRAGAVREQLLELNPSGASVALYIEDFPSVAPIGPTLRDPAAVDRLAEEAQRRVDGPSLFVLGRWPAGDGSARRTFQGVRLFPWRATRDAVDLAQRCRDRAEAGGEQWAAAAVPLEKRGDTWVLEMRNGSFVSRQAIPVARNWQTRIFLRGLADDDRPGLGTLDGPPCEVSIQMAPRRHPVVYHDHWQTVEVARRALERGRNIFTSDRMISQLLHGKFDNPIAGITGLHLLLDGLGGGPHLGEDHPKRHLVDEVLENLTRLLQPGRPPNARLHDHPAWPELPDMTALRLRAGRALRQVEVAEPPLFKASWDAIKAHAGSEGLSWVGKRLWSVTGDANRLGPYLAWVPRQYSARRTAERIERQQAGAGFTESGPPARGMESDILRPAVEQGPSLAELARAYQVPLSIFEPKPKSIAAAPDETPRDLPIDV